MRKKIVVMLSLLFLISCNTPNVRVNYEVVPDIDYAQYNSFVVLRPTLKQTTMWGVKPQLYDWVLTALISSMEQRGLTLSDDHPDLFVIYSIYLKDKWKLYTIESNQIPGAYQSMHKVNYKEGTLLVNIIDAKTRSVVWKGHAIGSLPEQNKITEEKVSDVVSQLLANYPRTN